MAIAMMVMATIAMSIARLDKAQLFNDTNSNPIL
jgi:hypothetical protein